ncbi:helix-turn-helix domain-containing protein [Myceligenerans cantabricum]
METLGEFLRSRRASLEPPAVGLPGGQRRRVPGLRREEVALLASISPEYYVRLEQGRDVKPSVEVLEGLATAFRLTEDETRYLIGLAYPERGSRGSDAIETVAPGTIDLMESWPMTPAYITSPGAMVLASNAAARVLSPSFVPGVNTYVALFCDPAMREFYADWDQATAKAVEHLRAAATGTADGTRLGQLIDRLRTHSDRFRMLWEQRAVRNTSSGVTRFRHPEAGAIELRYDKLTLGASHQLMVVYHARPGSADESVLRTLLGSAAAE